MMKDEEILSLRMEILECRRVARDLTKEMKSIERNCVPLAVALEINQDELEKKDVEVRKLDALLSQWEACAVQNGWARRRV